MMETVQIRRLRWLLWILLAWTLAIFARLVLLQALEGSGPRAWHLCMQPVTSRRRLRRLRQYP